MGQPRDEIKWADYGKDKNDKKASEEKPVVQPQPAATDAKPVEPEVKKEVSNG